MHFQITDCFLCYDHFNIHSFAIEMFKVSNNIALTIIDYILTRSDHTVKPLYNGHHRDQKSVHYKEASVR